MPRPGTTCVRCSRSAKLPSPRARAAATCVDGDSPAGSRSPRKPREDDVGGAAEDARAEHHQRHAGDGQRRAPRTRAARSGRSRRISRCADGPKFIDFSAGMPRRHPRRPAAAAAPRRRPPGSRRRRVPGFAVSAGCVGAAHAASSARAGCARSRRRPGRSRAARRGCRRRRSRRRRGRGSGRRRGSSTPAGPRRDRGVARDRPQRRAQARVGARVEGRERVVEQVDLGSAHDRPGDGQALPLPAGEVGAALRDGRVEPVGQALDEVARLRDLERRHSSSSVASGLPWRRVLATVPENR